MEGIRSERERGHLFIGDLATRWVAVRVELTLHGQSGFGRGRRNHLQDHGVTDERLAAPILANPGKEAMLDLVPFARARRQVADGDCQPGFIGQWL